MAQQEEQRQQGPLQSAANVARSVMDLRSGAGVVKSLTSSTGRLLAAVVGFKIIAIILLIALLILIIIVFIIVILVVIGVIPGGGGSLGTAHAFGSGLGVKDNYCQTALSPEDLNGNGRLDDCSQVLLTVLNEAAAAAKMPVGVLVAIGLSENLKDVMRMSEADIERFSEPGAEMPGCAVSSAGAKGPMQFTDGSVPGTFDTWSAHKNFIIDAGARPQGYEPKICNIKDNIFAAAHKLKSDAISPFDQPTRDWTQDEVYFAARSYLGDCESHGVTYCANVWEFYQNKKDEGVIGAGPGGQACYQFDSSWGPEQQAQMLETIDQLTSLAGFSELLCNGGPVTMTSIIQGYSHVNGGRHMFIKFYPNPTTRLFVLAHESAHVIGNVNPGLLQSFADSRAYQQDGGLIRSYPRDALGGTDCSVDADIPWTCFDESMAEATAWVVAGTSYTSGNGANINLQQEYPNHYRWVTENVFQ